MGESVSDRSRKTPNVSSAETAAGYGELFAAEHGLGGQADNLVAALDYWADSDVSPDEALAWCVRVADHRDPRIRARAMVSVGKILPKLHVLPAATISAVARAMTDPENAVRDAAKRVAKFAYDDLGIKIEPSSQ